MASRYLSVKCTMRFPFTFVTQSIRSFHLRAIINCCQPMIKGPLNKWFWDKHSNAYNNVKNFSALQEFLEPFV